MRNRIIALLAGLAMALGVIASGSSALASVPDWDSKLTTHTPAEWDAIKTVLNTPADWVYGHNLPASPTAKLKKDAGDCPAREISPYPETLCLWNGYGYEGTIWKIPIGWLFCCANGNLNSNGLSFTGSGINNASKGWWNRSYQQVTLYDNAVCQDSGWIRELAPNQFAVSDNAASNDWENRISSASMWIVKGYACTNDPNQ